MPKPLTDRPRCVGVYLTGDKTGQRCERLARESADTCYAHRGPDEDRCVRRLSKHHPTNPGGPCPNAPMRGQTLCRVHGGKARRNQAAAERRLAEADLEAQVTRQLAAQGIKPVDNPLEALAQLAGEVIALKDALADRVNALNEVRYESKAGGEQVRAEVALYERALDRCNTVLGNIAKLKIDERLVRIKEMEAAIVVAAVKAALDHAGISGQRYAEACQVAARHLERASR